jgi:hypothetical protein
VKVDVTVEMMAVAKVVYSVEKMAVLTVDNSDF